MKTGEGQQDRLGRHWDEPRVLRRTPDLIGGACRGVNGASIEVGCFEGQFIGQVFSHQQASDYCFCGLV